MMGKVISREACPQCRKNGNDNSGDNLARYDDGHAWCFSCGHLEGVITSSSSKSKPKLVLPDVQEAALPDRGLSVATLRHFSVFKEVGSKWFVLPYFDKQRNLVGIKYRDFSYKGDKKRITYDGEIELFGLSQIRKDHKACILWEGETDTMSAWQIDSSYAHLGIPGVSSAEKLMKRHAYWLRQRFSKIYLFADNDDAGAEMRETVAAYIPGYCLYELNIADHYPDINDFNEALTRNLATKLLPLMIREAQPLGSDDLLTGEALSKSFKRYATDRATFNGYSTGFETLDIMIGGGLHVGEVLGLVGHTGRGKSTFARDVAMNIADVMDEEERVMWIGTEMDANLMVRKFIEREAAQPFVYTPQGVPSISAEEQEEHLSNICQRFVFYSELCSDYERVEKAIINAIHAYNVRVVVIDVLSDIDESFSDWQKASAIIGRLHKLAQGDAVEKRPPIAVFCVSHTIGSDDTTVTLSNLRGGSAIRQKMTCAVSFEGDINDLRGMRKITRLKKSRVYDGDETSEVAVLFDRTKMRYIEVAQIETDARSRIERIIERKERKRRILDDTE